MVLKALIDKGYWPVLSHSARAVFIVYCYHRRNTKPLTGGAWPGVQTISRESGCSPQQIADAKRELIAYRLLRPIHREDRRGLGIGTETDAFYVLADDFALQPLEEVLRETGCWTGDARKSAKKFVKSKQPPWVQTRQAKRESSKREQWRRIAGANKPAVEEPTGNGHGRMEFSPHS